MSTRINAITGQNPLDPSAIAVGDMVWIEMKITSPAHYRSNHPGITIGANFHEVPIADIVGHRPAPPKPLAVGEKVKVHGYVGVILTMDGDDAWLRHSDSSHVTCLIADLERCA